MPKNVFFYFINVYDRIMKEALSSAASRRTFACRWRSIIRS